MRLDDINFHETLRVTEKRVGRKLRSEIQQTPVKVDRFYKTYKEARDSKALQK